LTKWGGKTMNTILHITSGDCAGESLGQAGLPGDLLVWNDILYDGPRESGWPTGEGLTARAMFLERQTGGGMTREQVLQTLRTQYQRLAAATSYRQLVLWFDACLFDQSMLAHILVLLHDLQGPSVELLCVDSFPGIEPFNGLGQLQPTQLASLYDERRVVTKAQFQFAEIADQAFAGHDLKRLADLAKMTTAPLPWVPAAAARLLAEQPDSRTGLGRLEYLALEAIRRGSQTPGEIFSAVAAEDTPPQYWGDITLWAKINSLADRNPPLVRIEGPAKRLPQWKTDLDWEQFRITSLPEEE